MIWGQQKQENGEAASKEFEKPFPKTEVSTPVKPTPLAPELQKLVDDDEDFFDQLYDG